MQEQADAEKKSLLKQLAVSQDALQQSQAELTASSSSLRELQQETLTKNSENHKLAAEKAGFVEVNTRLNIDLRNLQVR